MLLANISPLRHLGHLAFTAAYVCDIFMVLSANVYILIVVMFSEFFGRKARLFFKELGKVGVIGKV